MAVQFPLWVVKETAELSVPLCKNLTRSCPNRLCRVPLPRSVPDWDVSEDVQSGATPLLPFFFQLLWLQCQYFRSSSEFLFLPNCYHTVRVLRRQFFISSSLCRSLLAVSLRCCGVSSGQERPLASAFCVLSVCWGSSRSPSQCCRLPLFSFVHISLICSDVMFVQDIQEWNN